MTTDIDANTARRKRLAWGVLLGAALGVPALGLAAAFGLAAIAVFNGCYGPRSEVVGALVMAWIVVLWPLTALGSALAPAWSVARGRGWKRALSAWAVGAVVAAGVYLSWFVIAGALMC